MIRSGVQRLAPTLRNRSLGSPRLKRRCFRLVGRRPLQLRKRKIAPGPTRRDPPRAPPMRTTCPTHRPIPPPNRFYIADLLPPRTIPSDLTRTCTKHRSTRATSRGQIPRLTFRLRAPHYRISTNRGCMRQDSRTMQSTPAIRSAPVSPTRSASPCTPDNLPAWWRLRMGTTFSWSRTSRTARLQDLRLRPRTRSLCTPRRSHLTIGRSVKSRSDCRDLSGSRPATRDRKRPRPRRISPDTISRISRRTCWTITLRHTRLLRLKLRPERDRYRRSTPLRIPCRTRSRLAGTRPPSRSSSTNDADLAALIAMTGELYRPSAESLDPNTPRSPSETSRLARLLPCDLSRAILAREATSKVARTRWSDGTRRGWATRRPYCRLQSAPAAESPPGRAHQEEQVNKDRLPLEVVRAGLARAREEVEGPVRICRDRRRTRCMPYGTFRASEDLAPRSLPAVCLRCMLMVVRRRAQGRQRTFGRQPRRAMAVLSDAPDAERLRHGRDAGRRDGRSRLERRGIDPPDHALELRLRQLCNEPSPAPFDRRHERRPAPT